MKFAHMADLHLGGWRDPELEKLNLSAFEKALDTCIAEKVDFIVISGDFFDTSMPPFDTLDFVTSKLNELKKSGMPVYTISGSHDFSPSGKTILKVLENAELITNVARGEELENGNLRLKFTSDKKTGAKLTGIFGKKGSLDEEFYRQLDRKPLEDEPGYKIFLFHAGIEEYRPEFLKDVAAMPLSLLPKNFDYYAGGHIHQRSEKDYSGGRGGKGKVVFPGPLFPCNFQELERLKAGGFYIVEDGKPRFIEIKEKEVVCITADAEGKAAKDVEAEIAAKIDDIESEDYLLLIRAHGTLNEGKPADINFRALSEEASKKGAIAVRRSTSALASREYEEVKVSTDTIENLEARLITEHLGQSGMPDEKRLIGLLMRALDTEKADGETNAAFEERLLKEIDNTLK